MRLGALRMTVCSGRGVGRLARLVVLVAALLGSVLLLPGGAALAARGFPPGVEAPEAPRLKGPESPRIEPPEPPGAEAPQPSTVEADERNTLALANSRHGLPSGVAVPQWALEPGRNPYFAPSPRALGKEPLTALSTATLPSLFGELNAGEPKASRGLLKPEPHDEAGGGERLGLRYEGEVPPIRYLGGTVQLEPKVDVIFWGSHWSEEPGSALRTKLLKFYEGLSGSAEQDILTQYFDTSGYISSKLPAVKSAIDTRVGAPTNVNYKSIEEEVKYAEGVMGAHNNETQYEVLTAPGSTYEASFTGGFCAFHDFTNENGIYSFVPYAGDEPFNKREFCTSYYGRGSAADATNVMASHEYAETATDPLWKSSPGWRSFATDEGEISDLCATPGDELKNGSWVQGWYDDHQNACSESDENPPHVLGLTETAAINNVTKKEATLKATVNPENLATTYQFEYGLTNTYGSKVPEKEESAGTTQANVPVSQPIKSLELEKPYHYRVVAKNSSGTTDGEDRTVIPSKWSVQTSPGASGWGESWLNGVSCGSPSSCMAVGYYYQEGLKPEPNQALSYQLVGGQWVQRTVPLSEGELFSELKAVACTSPNACTAVGNTQVSERFAPLIARWTGTAWSRQSVTLPAGSLGVELWGVSCMTETECVAVGSVENSAKVWVNYSALWSHGSWTSLTTPTSGESTESVTTGIACGSTTSCVATGWFNPSGGGGSKAFSMVFSSGAWSYQSRTWTGGLEGVTCASAEYCVAVGIDYAKGASIETWNGTAWSGPSAPELPDVEGGFFQGVSCLSSSDCTAVGGGYSKVTGGETNVTVAVTWNGTSWKEQSTPRESEIAPNYFTGVSCAGAEGCTTVGQTKASDNWESLLETRGESTTPTHLLSFGSYGSSGGKLYYPEGVAVDASGNVWVADEYNDRVEEFNSKGEWVLIFGKEVNKTKVEAKGTEAEQNLCTAASGNVCQAGTVGSANGQLNLPADVAITASGNIWVTEEGNGRVQEFNTKGEYLAKFGVKGTGEGQLAKPVGIAITPSGNIWVSDPGYYRIEEFTSTGGFIREEHGVGHGGTGNGEFYFPEGLAIDPNGDVWVVDFGNDRVQEFSSTGEYISKFGAPGTGEGQFAGPLSIAAKPSGNLLIGEREVERVQIFTPSGEYVTHFAMEGEAGGIALAAGGTEYVSGGNSNHIEKWGAPAAPEVTTQPATSIKATEATLKGAVNPSGVATTYHFEYGTTTLYGTSVPVPSESVGSGIEAVSESHSITALQPETTYHFRIVASNTYGTIYGQDSHFTTPPDFEFSFGSSGSGGGKLSYPDGVATDASGNVWVADSENARVAEFNSKGEWVLVFGKEVNKTKVEASGTEAEKNLCTAASGNVCQAGTVGSGNGQLSEPQGIAFTSAGNMWVTEEGNGRVQEFNTKGEYLAKFGVKGTGEGQLARPYGIAIASGGDIWVSDPGYYRIGEFTSAGEFIREEHGTGHGGTGNGEFEYPEGLAIDSSGNVWVVDFGDDRVQEFSATGGYISKFGTAGTGEGQFAGPLSIAIKPSGNLLIGEREVERVQIFTPSGEYLTHVAMGGEAAGIALAPAGAEYVTGSNDSHIEKWGAPIAPEVVTQEASSIKATEATLKGTVNPNGAATTYYFQYGTTTAYGEKTSEVSAGSGWTNVNASTTIKGLTTGVLYHFRLVATNRLGTTDGKDATFATVPGYSSAFGSEGTGNGQFKHPGDVVLDSKGNLWVVDHGNDRVEEFNEKGEYQKAFGSVGSGNGQLKEPDALAVDTKGNVWVVDTGNSRVEEFNEKGEYVKAFGAIGAKEGQFSTPEGIAIDSKGNVWVSDTGNGRLQEFNEKGEYVKTVGAKGSGAGQIGESEGIAIDTKGNVWVADWSNDRVDEFNEKGEYVREFGTVGSGNGQLKSPYGIAVESDGTVWVGDTGNDRVEAFNEKGEYVTQFGSAGSGAGQFSFSYPIGLTTDSKGDIWVTDPGNERIQKWV
jgi:sugar lactone lactonase YvrE